MASQREIAQEILRYDRHRAIGILERAVKKYELTAFRPEWLAREGTDLTRLLRGCRSYERHGLDSLLGMRLVRMGEPVWEQRINPISGEPLQAQVKPILLTALGLQVLRDDTLAWELIDATPTGKPRRAHRAAEERARLAVEARERMAA